jgi:glycosyltransferase involved in cell wall biosynthesis
MKMKNKNPLVSIIIPAYKRVNELKRAIDSVIKQTYKNWELIVVDDNFSNSEWRKETEELIKKYNVNNDKIRYIKHKKNKGGSAARNTGIKNAKGAYIAFLDNDDEWLEEKLEKQISVIQKENKERKGIYCGSNLVGDINQSIYAMNEGNLQLDTLKGAGYMNAGSTLLVDKSVFDRIGLFDESFKRHQEMEFLVRFFRHFKVSTVAQPLVKVSTEQSTSPLDAELLVNLKEKFLKKFKNDIKKYSEKEINKIYYSHYIEICKHFASERNLKKLIYYYAKCKKYGRISLKSKLVFFLNYADGVLKLGIKKKIKKILHY